MQEPVDPLSQGDANSIEQAEAEETSTAAVDPTRESLGVSGMLRVLWSAIAVPSISLLAFLLTSTLMIAVATLVVRGSVDPRSMFAEDSIREVSASRAGFLIMLVTPQIALLLPSLLAAFVSPEGPLKRLSLERGHWPLWTWVAAALATPLIGWMSSLVVSSFMEESERLEMMGDVFRTHGATGFLIPLAFAIGATPAICEELLFRGYVQTGLSRSLPPQLAILMTSIVFAAFHLDPIHSVAVFPLGIYLGCLVWRSGSIVPAMLAHFVNNVISVFAVVLMPEERGGIPSPQAATFLLIVLTLAFFGGVFTMIAFWLLPGPARGSAANASSEAK